MHPQYTKKERKYKPMSDTILALLGFATVIAVIVLLLRNVTVPALAFVSVSTITAAILVATGAFTLDEMAGFIKEGVKGVHGTAILFIFSVLFFGVMTDAGMFDKIIGALMKKVGSNVIGVALMTCLIAIIGHLDGGGASTFLITIPAMLPVYKRLHMRRETLLLICVTSMGVMNLLPWGGPTMRAASVLGVESNDLWSQILPMQVVGLVLAVGTAIFWGLQEKKRIAKLGDAAVEDVGKYDDSDSEEKNNELARPKNFIFNVILTLAVIIVLVLDIFPSYYVFMVGCALGILVNYRGKKLQNSIIKSHAASRPDHGLHHYVCRCLPRCPEQERHHGENGHHDGQRHPGISGPFPAHHHRRPERASGSAVRYRLLLLRPAARPDQRWQPVRRQPGSHRHRNGRLPQLRYLHQPGGSRYLSGHRSGRCRDQGPHQVLLRLAVGCFHRLPRRWSDPRCHPLLIN